MRKFFGFLVFGLIATGPLIAVWYFLQPTGFWQKIIFLAIVAVPEAILVALATLAVSWVNKEII